MERKQAVKIEDSIRPSPFPDPFPVSNPLIGMLDLSEGEKSSLGFMELLGIQDFTPSIFDVLQVPTPSVEVPLAPTQTSAGPPESSEVLMNQPMTPNSSSISSASSGAPNDEQSKAVDDEEEELQKTNKQLKPKKTCQKRERAPRFAFMTKSEVDHLEDGYRWRKYGQKAVKNSPFPRNYYRCTCGTCNVKKRVERSFSDPTVVVTTYEGKHTHPSPVMRRHSTAGLPPPGPGFSADVGAATFALPRQVVFLPPPPPPPPPPHHHHHQSQFSNQLPPMNCGYLSYINPTTSVGHERRFCSTSTRADLLTDNDLIQDIVMGKEE